MCDDNTEADLDRLIHQEKLTRRTFNTLTAGAAVSVILPNPTSAETFTEQGVTASIPDEDATVAEHEVTVGTPDGDADAYFVHPAKGRSPGVILWPDIFGLRPAFRQMGKRLAESGYAVLVVNPYYRTAASPVVAEGEDRRKVFQMAQTLSAETTITDAKAFVTWLDNQESVDSTRRIGTMGYCMTGPFTIRTAAAVPDRIGAAASFHGGGLVADDDSPHLLIKDTEAEFLIAIADNDDQRAPEVKEILKQTFEDTGKTAEVEVYKGAMHGWCALDSRAYNQEAADRAWARLLVLLGRTLVQG